jgi:FtsP/CotA-like multicopper oxidase with cupredoxin domain
MEQHTLADIQPWLVKGYDHTAPNFIPAFGNLPSLSNICANFDSDPTAYEDWVLENWSNEIHNFHIHQTRFTIAPRGVDDENYFSFRCAKPAYVTNPTKPDYAADKPCWLDQTKDGDPQTGFGDELIAQFYRGHLSTGFDSSVVRDAAHDSVPLPRGTTVCDGHVWSKHEIDEAMASNQPVCRPGRVTVRLRFNRREQIGTFVYHCHILEHEDRGMMGLIEVRDPKAHSVDVVGE